MCLFVILLHQLSLHYWDILAFVGKPKLCRIYIVGVFVVVIEKCVLKLEWE